MSTLRLSLTTLALGLTLAQGALAAGSATATAGATLIRALSITKWVSLEFGYIAASAAGDVTVATTGTRTTSGPTLLTGGTGPTAARFGITGANYATYTITLPSSANITRQSGSEIMTVRSFISSPSGTGTLSATGGQTLKVGATVTLPARQAIGTYSGTFNVTVAYN